MIENGWAERHPLAGRYGLPSTIVMVEGPRDEEELAVIEDLCAGVARVCDGAVNGGIPPSPMLGAWLLLAPYMATRCEKRREVTRKDAKPP